MAKNEKRGFGLAIASEVLQEMDAEGVKPLEARNDKFVNRSAAIERFSSDIVYGQNVWVDPAVCKPSPENARDYSALTYEDCRELIDAIKAEGRQRFPAIVRRVDDTAQPYEIVAGLRRHWAISWLRANSYPEYKYLIQVEKLDDEAAFRLSDLENRARTDINDVERAVSYANALARHYDGDTNRMAERLNFSVRSLQFYLLLARLDPVLINALGGARAAKVVHARTLTPELGKSLAHREKILAKAVEIAAEQKERAAAGEPPIPAAEVVKRLVKAPTERLAAGAREAVAKKSLSLADGRVVAEFTKGTSRQGAQLKILPGELSLEELTDIAVKFANEVYAGRRS